MKPALCLTLVLAFALSASAQEVKPVPADPDAPAAPEKPPEPVRGFVDGRFVDEYFGITYRVEGLEKGFSMGGPAVLFSGRCPGGVDVEIAVAEAPRELTGTEWVAMARQAWAQDGQARTEVEEGSEPVPHLLFVQESLAGFRKHHGYAFFARGFQLVQVHCTVREKSETSGDAIRAAFGGLTLAKESESFVLAHLIARQQGQALDDPRTLLGAGMAYMQAQPPNPALALRALRKGEARAAETGLELTPDDRWSIISTTGLAQLTMGLREEAIGTWKEAIRVAEGTQEPKDLGMNAHYNLACAYSLLGRLDEAFDALGKAYATGTPEGVASLRQHGEVDPDLESMRKDPRWAELSGK